jgi:hypothetical protein
MPEEREQFLDETRAFWQPLSPRPIAREDARQMVANVAGFFGILAEWDRKAREQESGEKAAS